MGPTYKHHKPLSDKHDVDNEELFNMYLTSQIQASYTVILYIAKGARKRCRFMESSLRTIIWVLYCDGPKVTTAKLLAYSLLKQHAILRQLHVT